MYDDPIGALEAELLAAARRRAHRTTRERSRSLGTVLTAAAAVLALIVAVGAVALLGRHGGGAGRASGQRTVTSRSLTSRASISVSVGSSELTLPGSFNALLGTVAEGGRSAIEHTQSVFRQLGLERYQREAFTAGAVTVPGDVRIELWEVVTPGAAGAAHDQLAAVVAGRVVAHAPAAQVRRRGLLLAYGYTSSGTRVAVVVPNRVARVALSVSGGPSMLAPVHRNIAAFDVPGFRLVRILSGSEAVWYDPQRRVLKRISPSQP